MLQVPHYLPKKLIYKILFVFKQAQTGTQSHFQLHMSQVDSTALGQVLPISVPPSETELDSIIGTFPTDPTTYTVATTSTGNTTKRRSPDPEGDESQKQDEVPSSKRTRASAKKQLPTDSGPDPSVFTPPDDQDALNEQDEAMTGTKRQRTKRGATNGSSTPAQGSKTATSVTRRKRGGKS